MVKLTKTATCTKYAINISKENLLKILEKDSELLGSTDIAEDPLYLEIETCSDGISEIDYDGHFGPYIFLTLEKKYDTDATWDVIYSTIRGFLEG